ncbi:dihydropyrimidinase [bacterium]|nr:dihydropyrimidinase [bacterium]
MSVLIKNGRIITAVEDFHSDIFIQDETVTTIGKNLDMPADEIIDAKGRYVIPGGVDPHTHFDMPFGGTVTVDNFASGTRAAAHGGTTTMIDFAIQTMGESPLKGLETWHQKAAGNTAVDYAFHMILTDMEGERMKDMRSLIDEGITSFKLFMAYPGVLYMNDGMIYRTMREAGEFGALICMHAENGIVIDEIIKEAIEAGKTEPKWHGLTRPTQMEAEAVHRTIAISELANVPIYIVHLTCSDALEEVKQARANGLPVHAETCPQYLLLDHSYLEQDGFEGAKYVMSPPLREKWNQEELWRGLQMGHLQAVATDHCSFRFHDQKTLGKDVFTKIPNGAPGVENRLSLIFNGGVVEDRISLNKFVDITSTAAAKIFGLYPKKGTIAVGSDADIVIFDPERRETISVNNPHMHHLKADYNAFEGFEVTGISETVLSRGRVIVRKGEFVGEQGHGQFVKRNLFTA